MAPAKVEVEVLVTIRLFTEVVARDAMVTAPSVAFWEKRLVEEAMLEKNEVEVEFVVVLF